MGAGNQTALEIATTVQRKKLKMRNTTQIENPTSRNVISVGCKYPHGLHLDIRQHGQPVKRVTLKGINSLSKGMIIRPATIGGYAVTDNVPKEFFEEWMRLNACHPAVVNHLVFAHEEKASVVAMAEERSELKNGLDPIDPSKKILGQDGKVVLEARNDMD
jgi:hypothetical protein